MYYPMRIRDRHRTERDLCFGRIQAGVASQVSHDVLRGSR